MTNKPSSADHVRINRRSAWRGTQLAQDVRDANVCAVVVSGHQHLTADECVQLGNFLIAAAQTEQAQESTAARVDAFPPCDACHAPYGTHAAHCWREGVIR